MSSLAALRSWLRGGRPRPRGPAPPRPKRLPPPRLYPAEFVFPAHPDKLADAIADAIVQDAARRDDRALAAIEVGMYQDSVFVTGMINGRGSGDVPVDELVRGIYRSAGFCPGDQPDPETLKIHTAIVRDQLSPEERAERSIACDQSITPGYAANIRATNYLPVEHWLANRLGRRLARLWREEPDLHLGPDGKLLVAVEEFARTAHERGFRLRELSCSLQQRPPGNVVELHRRLRLLLQRWMERLHEGWDGLDPELPRSIRVNGAGAFECGGTYGDNGLSGKKLVVDAYGPRVPIGGGALSGKDFFHVDRAGALHARRLAQAAVLNTDDPAAEARVCLGWAPGERRARVLAVETRTAERWWTPADPAAALATLFSGSPPGAGGPRFDLTLEDAGVSWTGVGDLVEVARYGHFTEPDRPWELAAPSGGVISASSR